MTINPADRLREERNRIWNEMTEILDTALAEGRGLSGEESQKYDRMEADLDAKSAELARLERHAERGRQMSTVAPPPAGVATEDDGDTGEERGESYAEAFAAYIQRGMGHLDAEQRTALRAGFVRESRAQSVGTDSAGGYLVPPGFWNKITETLKQYGSVERVAQVIDTDTGNALEWPTNDDTSNKGALLAENTQVTEQDLTIGTKTLDAYKYTSKLVRVSLEFLQDVAWMDAEDFLARKLGERVGRIVNEHLTTGTGTSQPNGMVTAATSGVTAASTTAITADELLDLIHSVDPAYRNERSRFMMNDTAFKAVRKLKDGNSNYLFQPAAAQGEPDTLFGYPVEINQDMASPATTVKSVLFGDFFAGYVVRRVRAFQLIRMDERYADYFQVGFVGFARYDGEAQDTGAYKALTQA